MSVRNAVRSPVGASFKNENLQGGSASSGGQSVPLRFASASNQYSSNAPFVFNLGTGALQTDILQNGAAVLGQDMTLSMVLGMTAQWLKATVGVSDLGNALTVMEMAAVYNGIVVQITTGGLTTWTVANAANWLSDPIPPSAFSVAKYTKGTTVGVRVRFRSNAPTTDKFPQGRGRGIDQVIYLDPAKSTVTTGVLATGTMAYTMTNGGVNGTDAKFGNSLIPIFVLGYHASPSIVMPGDSKTFGTGDTSSGVGVIGMSRALFSDPSTAASVQCSGLNMGCPSGTAFETFTATAGGVVANHEFWYTLANYALVGYGTNSLTQSWQTTLYARLRANGVLQIIQRSLTPRTQPLNTDPVSITSLTTDTVTTTVTGTMADTSGLTTGQSYPISGATPAAYNGTFAITVLTGTTFTYSALTVPASNATGTLVLNDQWRTTKYQVAASGWSVGGAADTFEQFLRGNVSSDANLTYYQSAGERASATLGTAAYWQWAVNGSANYCTTDGLHEGGTVPGYELNIGTGGTITTLAGGTVSRTLRAHIGTLT